MNLLNATVVKINTRILCSFHLQVLICWGHESPPPFAPVGLSYYQYVVDLVKTSVIHSFVNVCCVVMIPVYLEVMWPQCDACLYVGRGGQVKAVN